MSNDLKDNNAAPRKSPKSIDAVSQFPVFFGNDHHAYAARKAERLSSAIHVVTGFIPREEPIRGILREVSLTITRLAADPAKLGEGGPQFFSARCAEISTLLETAEAAGLISNMNARLIVSEYASLSTFVRERFALIRPRVLDISDSILPPMSYRNQKDTIPYKTQYRTAVSDNVEPMNGDRKSEILGLLNVKDRISIKDAIQSIPGVSEKTIQRVLMSLVAQGLIIKEGDRRWSTYKLAQKPNLQERSELGSIPS